jgi:hypothetical protein
VEKWVDEIVAMSDAVIGEPQEVVTATRHAVDARKWLASKLMPQKYGDQATGVTVNAQVNVLAVTDEQLAQLQEARQKLLQQSSQ